MKTPREIIHKLGGVGKLALALQCSPTAVRNWRTVGARIPPLRHDAIMAVARRMGVKLSREQLATAREPSRSDS